MPDLLYSWKIESKDLLDPFKREYLAVVIRVVIL
jgi:hypothetical protein